MLEEFADRIQNAKDKQFKIFERFHVGDTVYPFWLTNFVVYGTVIDIDTVARKVICDFNGVRRQFCPEDLMVVNPAFTNQKAGLRTAEWKNSFKKQPALEGVKETDADNGIHCVCKECGGEIAVSYDERSAKTDFVCTKCGKRISEDKVSKKCKEKMRKASVDSEIEKARKKLVSEARKKGISENFGQTEVSALRDKYGDSEKIREFDDWCQNFDLGMLRKASIDNKDYSFYVVLDDGKIESGWEYREDAEDRRKELKDDGHPAKTYARRHLKSQGNDPADDSNWHKGRISSEDSEIEMVAKSLLAVAKELLAVDGEKKDFDAGKRLFLERLNSNLDRLRGKLHDDGIGVLEVFEECEPMLREENANATQFHRKAESLLDGKYSDTGERILVRKAFSNAFNALVKNCYGLR